MGFLIYFHELAFVRDAAELDPQDNLQVAFSFSLRETGEAACKRKPR